MPSSTTNYQFPLYESSDSVNLLGAYNQAIVAIDAKLKEIADSASSEFDPKSTDTIVTVGDMSTLKKTTNGIVYKPTS